MPVIRAIRDALPEMPISVDTTKPAVAEAALDAGADLVNDVWGVAADDALSRLAAARGAPIVLMHNRAEAALHEPHRRGPRRPPGRDRPGARAPASPGTRSSSTPGSGSARRRSTTSSCCATSTRSASSAGRSCSATSRKSTLGKVLDLPADQRLEATLATTALAVAAGVDIVRVHDVRENVRAARMADAVVRADASADRTADGRGGRAERPDRAPQHPASRARHGYCDHELADPAAVRGRRRAGAGPPAGGDRRRPGEDVDYGKVVRRSSARSSSRPSFQLLEAIAEAIADEILADFPVDEVGVRVRKPAVQLGRPARLRGRRDPAPRARARPDARLSPRPSRRRQPEPGPRRTSAEACRPDAERDLDRRRLAVRAGSSSVDVSPGANWARTASSGCCGVDLRLADRVMMSPAWMPAASAGEPAVIGGLPFWSASRETSAPTLTGRLSVLRRAGR